MTMQEELASLVKIYAQFDAEKKCYTSKLNKAALLRLDADFIKLINKRLLADGPEKDKLLKNYRKMSLYFHPDRKPLFLPEVVWLEKNLAEGDSGICFKSLGSCYEKLTTPQKFKELSFGDIKSREDCRKWLENLKSKAGTYTARSFCDSLIGLLDESGGFFDEVGKIKPKGLRTLLTFMPMIFASYGTIIFAEELFAVYALYFLMLKGGQYLGTSDFREMRQLGETLQNISVFTATATTTVLVRLLEMTFWASHRCYALSLKVGASLLDPLLSAPAKTAQAGGAPAGDNFCKDLILASKNLTKGRQFRTPELKVIAAPFEAYLGLNEQQFFVTLRAGNTKRLKVEDFLLRMRVLDLSLAPIETKLVEAQKALKTLKLNKKVYTAGGKTADAVDCAEKLITLLIESELSCGKSAEEVGSAQKAITLLVEPDPSPTQLVVR